MEYEQLAEFVATMQVFVNYSHAKENRAMSQTHTVVVKTYDLAIRHLESCHALATSHQRVSKCFAQVTTVQVKKKVP